MNSPSIILDTQRSYTFAQKYNDFTEFEERVNKEINNLKNWDLEHQKQAKQPKDFEVLDNVKQKISNLEQLENLRTIYAIVKYHIDYERYQSYHLKKQSKQEA